MTQRPKRRRDKILDQAEILFARHGFDGVTMRQVASAAGVDLALPSYHYGSKRGVFDAVLLRRAEVLNQRRLDALRTAEERAAPESADLTAIIDAFLRPLLCLPELNDPDPNIGTGWRHYYELVAFVNNSPQWGGVLMTRFFDPLVARFIEALKKAMPHADEEALYWSYHFLSGALAHSFAQTGRIDHLSQGVCRSDDLCRTCDHLVPFVVAGFERLCSVDQGL